jgi:hypothetical protein
MDNFPQWYELTFYDLPDNEHSKLGKRLLKPNYLNYQVNLIRFSFRKNRTRSDFSRKDTASDII